MTSTESFEFAVVTMNEHFESSRGCEGDAGVREIVARGGDHRGAFEPASGGKLAGSSRSATTTFKPMSCQRSACSTSFTTRA